MKKIIIIIIGILFITGCQSEKLTPTSIVEAYLSKYQNLDKSVLKDLEMSLEDEKNITKEQKNEYKSLIEKQYQNLSYKIKNEEIVGNNATVEVEIEVLDYATSINNSKKYFLEHESEFLKENEAQIKEDDLDKAKTYIDYKIEKLKEQKNKTKYQITFDLEKSREVWELRNLNEIDRQKIHGLY